MGARKMTARFAGKCDAGCKRGVLKGDWITWARRSVTAHVDCANPTGARASQIPELARKCELGHAMSWSPLGWPQCLTCEREANATRAYVAAGLGEENY